MNLKLFTLFISFFVFSSLKSQVGFEWTAFEKNDSVFIKWIPKNRESAILMLSGELKISIKSDNLKIEVERVRYQEYKKSKTFEDKKYTKAKSVVDNFLDTELKSEKEKKFAFALFMIEASVSFEINELTGSYASFSKSNLNSFDCSLFFDNKLVSTSKVNAIKDFPRIESAKISLDRKRTVNLEWDAKILSKTYLGFVVERKEGNGEYKKMTKEPYVHLVTSSENKEKLAAFRDDSIVQGKTYTYRIVGLNYLGLKSGMSKELTITIPKLANANLIIPSISADKFERKILCKQTKENLQLPIQIDRYIVLRSTNLLEGYTEIKSTFSKKSDSLLEFKVLSEQESGDAYYYQIIGISSDLDTVISNTSYFFTLDQNPPKSAKSLNGKIDSLGIVSLNWEQNEDNDLLGFKVFRANSLKEEFVECTKDFAKTKSFVDSLNLNTLTNEIYYFVVAVDGNFNNSFPSDTIEILKPDTIAPVVAFILDLEKKQNGVLINWEYAVNNDKVINFLFRESEGKVDSLQLDDKIVFYMDSTLNYGKHTIYYLKTLDLSGNSTKSNVRSIKFEPGYRPKLENVKASMNTDKNSIIISWEKPDEKVFQYFIYRKRNDGKMDLIKTIDGDINNTSFQDNEVSISNYYYYLVQYQTEDGFRSLTHEPVRVKF